MGKIQLSHSYEEIISVENLLEAWKEFVRGKRGKRDVQEFSLRLMDNIFELHDDLAMMRYVHGGYHAFNISDPKPRNIHKASVRDRLLHHALYRILYPFFDRTFIADSFSCRKGKGTHAAINRFRDFAYRAGNNHMRTCWVLKCDIRKFFASINHAVLMDIIASYIPDHRIVWLIGKVVESFSSGVRGVGLPLGNLTSQLLVNIYMNEFDQFVKHQLHTKHYVRYADDFAILSCDRDWLVRLIPKIDDFLRSKLGLTLHPRKVSIETFASGIDFLGWVHFSDHRVLRPVTKRRMMQRITEQPTNETLRSYLGLIKHGNTFSIQTDLLQSFWLWKDSIVD